MYLLRSLSLLPFLVFSVAGAVAAEAVGTRWLKSNLTLELSSFVPVCAEDCFISFLQATFGLERGQRIPSLQELCSTEGKTGFTVGEGAVQCIAAERSIDGCLDQDANSSVIYSAHQMCSGQPGAITPTHGVITATLVLPPLDGGPVSFPAPPAKASQTTQVDLPSTLVVDTHTLIRATDTTAATSRPRSSETSSTADVRTTLRTSVATKTRAATETSTTTTTAAAPAGTGSTALTPFQKAGISVGVIGFALAAAGVFVVFRLHRARKPLEHQRLSDTPSRRDSWGYKFDRHHHDGSGNTRGNQSTWMINVIDPSRDGSGASSTGSTPPPPPPKSTSKPATAARSPSAAVTAAGPAVSGQTRAAERTPAAFTAATRSDTKHLAPAGAYDRKSWRHSAIGLAISPAASKNASPTVQNASRPTSKLLPAKPLLAIRTRGQLGGEPCSSEYTRVSPYPPVLPKLVIPQRHEGEDGDDFLLGLTKPNEMAKAKPKTEQTGRQTTKSPPRESTMTEFEEDGPRSSSILPEGQIWRPPSTGPLSATATYYVSDKAGNWVLGDDRSPAIWKSCAAEMTQGEKSPLSARPRLATVVVPPNLSVSSSHQVKTEEKKNDNDNNIITTSNITSNNTTNTHRQPQQSRQHHQKQSIRVVTDTDTDTQPPPPNLQDHIDVAQPHDIVPRPLFSSAAPGDGSARHAGSQILGRRSAGRRSLTRPRAPSSDSGITTFTFLSDDDNDGHLPNVQPMHLSPVVESPWARADANARWLVSYPRIPGRETGSTGTSVQLVPPPRMPIAHSCGPEASLVSNDDHHQQHHGDHGDAAAAAAAAATIPSTPAPASAINETRREATGPPKASVAMKPSVHHTINTTMTSPLGSLARSGGRPWPWPRPIPDAAALRTGSPTMRLVRPSPSPEPEPKPTTTVPADAKPQHRWPYESRTRDDAPQTQPQPQVEEEKQRQQQQQHHARRPSPSWIPCLPANPHPQNRPPHTSTLWLPPQARSTRRIETEPNHHQLTPRKAQMDAQRSLSGLQMNQMPSQSQTLQPWNPDPHSFHPTKPPHQAQAPAPAPAQAQHHHNHPSNPFHPQRQHQPPSLSIKTTFPPSSQPVPAPSTPWLTTLTPTRRGPHLYLNVD
ncbi:hypothetical protein E4U21_003541 [Claviceps maximensis]|nr:hypothetical protein E4U21_003541 [Claviceps maximensis]